MKKQIKSFKSAFRGFCFAVKSESHMRFHLVATFYVFVFGCFYDFSAAKLALLAVLCALVIALEMVNTCVEKLCDLFCDRYDFSVKIIKDIAAAAVLAVSFPAVFTAVLFFLDFEVIGKYFVFCKQSRYARFADFICGDFCRLCMCRPRKSQERNFGH